MDYANVVWVLVDEGYDRVGSCYFFYDSLGRGLIDDVEGKDSRKTTQKVWYTHD
jgi:hypothetical protein